MSNDISAPVMHSVLIDGDLAKLSELQRVEYMMGVCRALGLNPTTKPFEFIKLNGRLVMYAKKDCTEQLRQIHGISITIKSRESVGDCYVVTASAVDRNNRRDESIGAVPTGNLKGEALANGMMKAETKAKRRVTLSISGLGMLDETEVATIPGAQVVGLTEAQNNALLVADGKEPVTNQDTKAKAKALYDQVKAYDLTLAQEIKRQCGTGYEEMAEKLEEALHDLQRGDPALADKPVTERTSP